MEHICSLVMVSVKHDDSECSECTEVGGDSDSERVFGVLNSDESKFPLEGVKCSLHSVLFDGELNICSNGGCPCVTSDKKSRLAPNCEEDNALRITFSCLSVVNAPSLKTSFLADTHFVFSRLKEDPSLYDLVDSVSRSISSFELEVITLKETSSCWVDRISSITFKEDCNPEDLDMLEIVAKVFCVSVSLFGTFFEEGLSPREIKVVDLPYFKFDWSFKYSMRSTCGLFFKSNPYTIHSISLYQKKQNP